MLDGDVQLVASDGLTLLTEHATYADADGVVRAPGPGGVLARPHAGSGIGMTYDKDADVLAILDQAVVHVAADDKGEGAGPRT